MAYYKDKSDMFQQRAKNYKTDADRHYAMAMKAKEDGDETAYKNNMGKSQKSYRMMKENLEKAEQFKGKTWKD